MISRKESLRFRERLESQTPPPSEADTDRLQEEVREYVREAQRSAPSTVVWRAFGQHLPGLARGALKREDARRCGQSAGAAWTNNSRQPRCWGLLLSDRATMGEGR